METNAHQDYVNKLSAVYKAMNELENAAITIMGQQDNRGFQATVTDAFSMGPNRVHDLLAGSMAKLIRKLEMLAAVVYLKDLESIRGQGHWRETYNRQPSLLATIHDLREVFPELEVHSARLVVEAYKEKLFE